MNAKDIKEKRKNLGLTQDELAKKLGVSLKTISNYENGDVIPESKKELLRNVLFQNNINTINDLPEDYINTSPNDIEEIEEVIREREKIIELTKEPKIINHQKEMIKLLKIQIDLIKNKNFNNK